MVSRFYRYLSLLLVIVIVTSWFVLPENFQPFVPGGVEKVEAQAVQLDPTVDGVGGNNSSNTIGISTLSKGLVDNTCDSKYDPAKDASNLFAPNIHILNNLPGYQHICYFFDGDVLVHQFRYQLSPTSAGTVYHQRFKKDPLPVYGGCRAQEVVCPTDPSQYNFFTYIEPVEQKKNVNVSTGISYTGGAGSGGTVTKNVTETRKSSTQVQLYRFEPALTSATGASDPNFNAYLIAYNKQYVYGFYQEQNLSRLNAAATKATRDQDRLNTFDLGDDGLDFSLITPLAPNNYINTNPNDQKNRPQYHYIAAVNGLYGFKPTYCIGTCKLLPDSSTDQQKFELIAANVKRTFGQVTNKITNSLSGTGTSSVPKQIGAATGEAGAVTESFNAIDGDIDLTDDPAATNKQSPETSPILTVSNTHTGLPGNVIFKLKYALRVSTTTAGQQNNYFVFELDNRTSESTKNALLSRGLDPSLYFVVIDVAGNIGFVAENKSLNGGLLTSGGTGKDRIDDYKAVGKFDGSNTGYRASVNILNKPLNVNLVQYLNTITKRVYNEPNIPKVANADCQSSPAVSYPNLNTKYESSPAVFSYGIPIGDYRKCIHIAEVNENPPGWLGKWGIADVKLDQNTSDPCDQSTEGMSDFGKIIGKSLCWMLSILVSMSISVASFAIDFMLATIDIQ